jgi:hypothetical protein
MAPPPPQLQKENICRLLCNKRYKSEALLQDHNMRRKPRLHRRKNPPPPSSVSVADSPPAAEAEHSGLADIKEKEKNKKKRMKKKRLDEEAQASSSVGE